MVLRFGIHINEITISPTAGAFFYTAGLLTCHGRKGKGVTKNVKPRITASQVCLKVPTVSQCEWPAELS